MKKLILLVLILTCTKISFSQAGDSSSAKITYTLFQNKDKSWGYDVFIDGKKAIHQPAKPAIPGNSGFANKKAADAVAKLVVQKVQKGEMPPTVTVEELRKIKAI